MYIPIFKSVQIFKTDSLHWEEMNISEQTVTSMNVTYQPPSVSTDDTHTVFVLPQSVVDKLNDATAMKLIIPIIYVAIMMGVGIMGNILVIYIYGFRWHRTTTKTFVTTLAILDLVNCVITMPTEIIILRNFYYFDDSIFCKISRGSTFWMNNNSAIVLLIIAIDRFIKICLPNRKSFTHRGAKVACVVAVVIGFGVSWPGFVLYGRKVTDVPKGGGILHIVMCEVDDSMKNTIYPKAYYIYLWIAFLSIAVAMVILYTLVGVQIWIRKIRKDKRTESIRSASFQFSSSGEKKIYKGFKEGRAKVSLKSSSSASGTDENDEVFENNDSRQQRKHRLPTLASIKISQHGMQAGKATLMLALITIVYIVSFLPFLVITMIRTIQGDGWYQGLSDPERVSVNLFLRSYLISNTVNPIVYGFCNVQFRREVYRLLRTLTCRKKERRPSYSMSSTFEETDPRYL